jgi:FAD/FMN-containing dehydrogenase
MINLSRKPVAQFTTNTQERARPLIRCASLYRVYTRLFRASARFLPELHGRERAPTTSAYGPNYDRLVALKKKYDPSNFFRMNHNIKPSA